LQLLGLQSVVNPNLLRKESFTFPRNSIDQISSTPWLIAVFTSATCDACKDVVSKALVMQSREVSVVNVEYQSDKPVHERYAIDAVPTLVVADSDGVVRAGFIGPIKAQDLWAAVAECRDPGSTPEPHLGRDQLDNH
jgi:thioredoxin-like negative regulator of GroEL